MASALYRSRTVTECRCGIRQIPHPAAMHIGSSMEWLPAISLWMCQCY